jgi:uncharacterized tellurite resistance protein B-like protein
MALAQLLTWLGLADATARNDLAPLQQLVASLDRLEPERARHLARFAYLLGRVALADRHASDDETRAIELLVMEHGGVSADQAALVVGLAKSSNLLFGSTADYEVVRDFGGTANYEQKLALATCLFLVAASDRVISLAEETEIHRVVNQLKILPEDLTRLRVQHAPLLPGRVSAKDEPTRS